MNSHCFKFHRCYLHLFHLSILGEICVVFTYSLEAGEWKFSCKKCTIKRGAWRSSLKLLFFLNCRSRCRAPSSLLKLPISLIVVIEKFGCKGNVMSYYSSLWVAWLAQFSIKLLKVHSSLQSTFFTLQCNMPSFKGEQLLTARKIIDNQIFSGQIWCKKV